MKLPFVAQARVPESKIVGYLLSLEHRDGRGKALFFRGFGFHPDNWQAMAAALLQHAAMNEVHALESSAFGTRYILEAPLETPDGRQPMIRSVWFIDEGELIPRFVTAYPLNRR